MNSKRAKMYYKLSSQTLTSKYDFKFIDIDDVIELATVMLDSLKDTCEDRGETLGDVIEEIESVIGGSFAPFISEASYRIIQNEETAAAIMISYYEGYPLISEIFTNKKYQNSGMASSLIKKSVNSLLDMGYKDLILNVDIENIAAVNLYRKIGFEVNATVL
ncbi:GNAT family N-acetyltransferase [Desulfosporosinus fructosivorans]